TPTVRESDSAFSTPNLSGKLTQIRYEFSTGTYWHGSSGVSMYDAIVLSDLHLGSANCQAKSICQLLRQVADGSLNTDRIILNGDVFDSFDFRRLNKNHWKVLSLLRKLSDQCEIIWISGNHDGSAEIVSHLLGVTVKDDYVLRSGDKQIFILHGHQFDDFI